MLQKQWAGRKRKRRRRRERERERERETRARARPHTHTLTHTHTHTPEHTLTPVIFLFYSNDFLYKKAAYKYIMMASCFLLKVRVHVS